MNFPYVHTARTHFVVWLLNFSFLNVSTYSMCVCICCCCCSCLSSSKTNTEQLWLLHTLCKWYWTRNVLAHCQVLFSNGWCNFTAPHFHFVSWFSFFTCFNCSYLILPRILPMKSVAKCTISRNAIHSHPFFVQRQRVKERESNQPMEWNSFLFCFAKQPTVIVKQSMFLHRNSNIQTHSFSRSFLYFIGQRDFNVMFGVVQTLRFANFANVKKLVGRGQSTN